MFVTFRRTRGILVTGEVSMSGVFHPKDCNPNPSYFPSLSNFCIPECDVVSEVSPIQENPVVVTPIVDPPNIDLGCFPIKTESILTIGGNTPVLDFINDYSKVSVSKDESGDPVYKYDFCQPLLSVRLNIPRQKGTEMYAAKTEEELCGDNPGEIQLYRSQGSNLNPYKKVNAIAQCGSAGEGVWGFAWKDPTSGANFVFAEAQAGNKEGEAMSDAFPNDFCMVKFEGEDNCSEPLIVTARNVGRVQILTGDEIFGAFVEDSGNCEWRVKHKETCFPICETQVEIVKDGTGLVTVNDFDTPDVENKGDTIGAEMDVSVRYEPKRKLPAAPDPDDVLYFPCALPGKGARLGLISGSNIAAGGTGTIQPVLADNTPAGDPIPNVRNRSCCTAWVEQNVLLSTDDDGNFFFY